MIKIEDVLTTIDTVARSPLLETYNIGITVDSNRRRKQYRNFQPTWPHYLIIETGLSAERALSLEKALQEHIKGNKRSAMYKKYRGDTRHKSHTPSLGGLSASNPRCYDLYICWGNVGEN